MRSPIKEAKTGRRLDPLWVGAFMVLAAAGCDAAPDQNSADDSASEWQTREAHEVLLSVEEGLLEDGISLEFDVVAEGEFEAELLGGLRSEEGFTVELEAAGTFGGESVTLFLSAQNGRMTGGNADGRFDEPVPSELHEALVIGLTRMGILHNLARLVGGSPPDRAGGGVRAWVEARETEWVSENVEAGERGVAFEIWVEDQPAGEATLWLNGDGQLVGRNQIVRFPGGEMLVRERYSMNPARRDNP